MAQSARRYAAPKKLPAQQQQQWNSRYDAALKQAKIDSPDDERAQHAAANKAANKMLIIPAPESHADIVNMPEWQVQQRATKVIDDVEHATVVTIDGKKYAHPIPAKPDNQKPPTPPKQESPAPPKA